MNQRIGALDNERNRQETGPPVQLAAKSGGGRKSGQQGGGQKGGKQGGGKQGGKRGGSR